MATQLKVYLQNNRFNSNTQSFIDALRDMRCICVTTKDFWLSYKGHTVDALAPRGDEGRGYLR